MFTFNRVILTGRVATPPRRSYRPDGSPVIQFSLELDDLRGGATQAPAPSERPRALNHRDQRSASVGQERASADLVQIVTVGELAEAQANLQNGQRLLVIGRLNPRRWRTPEGRDRNRTEVIASELRTLSKEMDEPKPFPEERNPHKRRSNDEETG